MPFNSWFRPIQGAWRGNEPFQPDVQPPTAGGAQPPLPWQQPIMPQQQPTIAQEDQTRPWQSTPQMSFNLRPPMWMQPNWRQAWNYQQQPQQQLPSQPQQQTPPQQWNSQAWKSPQYAGRNAVSNFGGAWNYPLPSQQAPLKTSAISSYDWTN